MRTKLIRDHCRGCSSMKHFKEGFWDSPWAFFLPEAEYRRRNGYKTGKSEMGERWLIAICNDPDCYAKIAVAEVDLLGGLAS